MIKRWLPLAVLAVSGACSLAPEPGALGELGRSPATDPLTFVADGLGRWLPEDLARAGAALPEPLAADLAAWGRDLTRVLDFDFDQTDGWTDAGLDPDGSWLVAFDGSSGFLWSEEGRLRMDSAVPARTRAWAAARFDGCEPQADGSLASSGVALAVAGSRLIIVNCGVGREPAEQTAALWRYVDSFGQHPRADDVPAHRAVNERMPEGSLGAVCYRPGLWRAKDQDEPSSITRRWFVPFVDTLVAAFDRERAIAAASTSLTPELLGTLGAGADPRPALLSLPRPSAYAVLRLADPVALLNAVPSQSPMQLFDRKARRRGFDFAAWQPVLRDGFVGCAAYRREPGRAGFQWVFFARTTDPNAADHAIAGLLATYGERAVPVESPADTQLWVLDSEQSSDVAFGRRDGIVYVGDAVDAIATAVRGKAPPWEPLLAAAALGGLEVTPARGVGGLIARLDRQDDLLVATARHTGPVTSGSLFADVVVCLMTLFDPHSPADGDSEVNDATSPD